MKGVFDDYSGSSLKEGKNYIHFANSPNKVERCKKWLNDIASYILAKKEGKLISFKDEPELAELMLGAIERHETQYTIPICHTVYIKRAVIDFIKNYESSQA